MVNTNIIFSTICGLSTLLIWMFAYTFGALMGYMVVFGLTCGSYFALGMYKSKRKSQNHVFLTHYFLVFSITFDGLSSRHGALPLGPIVHFDLQHCFGFRYQHC